MKYMVNVVHLEKSDFNNGVLSQEIHQGKPSIILLQSNTCPHCDDAKLPYNELTKHANGLINVFSIQVEEQREIAQPIMDAVKAQGVPTYVVFGEDGVLVGQYQGGRDLNSLMEFVKTVKPVPKQN